MLYDVQSTEHVHMYTCTQCKHKNKHSIKSVNKTVILTFTHYTFTKALKERKNKIIVYCC